MSELSEVPGGRDAGTVVAGASGCVAGITEPGLDAGITARNRSSTL